MVSSVFSHAELIQAAQDLPAAPRLLVELGQAIRNPWIHSDEVTALLRQDAALVARLIRMANSAVYARVRPVGSIEEALACIGFREVHRLVGVVAAANLAKDRLKLYGVEGGRLRENSLLVAVFMEELADVAREDPRSCYTVGLLRSVGKMALDRLGGEQGTTPSFAESGETELDVWEQKSWGVTNCQAAEQILLHWRLPRETVIAIRDHYHPANLHNPVIHLLNLAAGAAERDHAGLPGEDGYWKFLTGNYVKAGLNMHHFPEVIERARRTYQRLHSVVG